MRFSNILYQVNYKRHFRRIWKRQGRLQASELEVPEALQEMGVPIKNAKEILLETKMFQPRISSHSIPTPPSILQRRKWFYVMNETTQVSESENQALALTKTVLYQGLPKELDSLVGVCSLPNQDKLVQTSLLQSHVWDGDQDKLPKKKDPNKPHYKFMRAYGTLYPKKVLGLMEKLTYLCDGATGKYPASLLRDRLIDAFCDLQIERNGDSVTFQMPSDIALTAHEPLKRFASAAEVAKTELMEVPNIYPIKPTLDLDKFEDKPFSTALGVFNNKHIHTLFIAHKSYDVWTPSHLLARAIATCFAFAAKEAQMKYGAKVGILPEPITVQCMCMDIKSANFLTYQLNTLNMDDNEGVKNQVWVGEHTPLYDEISEIDLITNYNPDVFAKMLALYVNGLQ